MREELMLDAIRQAVAGAAAGEGGPFGAVVARNGKIIARAHNTVLSKNDPTCHAEVNAIRSACRKLKRPHLYDCELYASCEPCPLCLAAALWARLPVVYYAATREDAAKAGFDDAKFWRAFKLGRLPLKISRINLLEASAPFAGWRARKGRKVY